MFKGARCWVSLSTQRLALALAPNSPFPHGVPGGASILLFRLLSSKWVLLGLLTAVLSAASTAHAQSAPHLDGRIETDPRAGLLRGNICLSKLPQQPTVAFLLNRGLNIREVRDGASGRSLKYSGYIHATNIVDATRYTVEGSVGAGGFCVSYVGAFPVYNVDNGELTEADWKGQIAFDGLTVRAAEQTRFYPVVLDAATGAALDKMSYRLEVSCSDCKSIYVNGSAPQAGPKATFSSGIPRQLLLYAGYFPHTSAAGLHFVGGGISPDDAEAVRSGIKAMADLQSAYFGVPYRDNPVYLTFASVTRLARLGRVNWAFVTWPTIAMDGRISFSTLLEEKDGRRVFSPTMYMAHEMAHYWFGTLYFPRGPLHWFLLESTAEFVALKAYRTLAGEAAYASVVRSRLKDATAAGEVVPLDSVEAAQQIGESYRYHLGPLLLLALEQHTGEAAVRQALRGLVINPPKKEIRYPDLRERLVAAGATEASLHAFEATCLQRNPTASGCFSFLPAMNEVQP